MKPKAKRRMILIAVLLGSSVAEPMAQSLELGHVRARTRGWVVEDGPRDAVPVEKTPSSHDGELTLTLENSQTEELLESPTASSIERETSYSETTYPEAIEVKAKSEALPPPRQASKMVAESSKQEGQPILIGGLKKRVPNPKHGYLAMGPPRPLRFSDSDSVYSRPPAPALPEFSFAPSEHAAYLIESALPEDAANDLAALSEIVVELEPHEVVSGKIDTRSFTEEEMVEHFEMDESRSTVLRPEEVLIFFETETRNGSAGALVPFSPAATPNIIPPVKSNATLKKE